MGIFLCAQISACAGGGMVNCILSNLVFPVLLS